VSKPWPYTYLAVAVTAVVIIFVGNTLAWARLQAVGVVLLGLGLAVVGIDSIRSRYHEEGVSPGRITSSSRFVFHGPGAISWGFLCVAVGLAMVTIAAVVLLGLTHAAERLVGERPGLVIAPLGFIFLCSAGGWLWGEEQMNSSPLMFLATLPHRLGALVAVLFSLAVLAVGVFELVAPAAFDQLVDQLRPPPFPNLPAR
jgi:hypothetical protein